MIFLPITREEMRSRGFKTVDFVFVSGDAYVDHPSFGAAIITRLLEKEGFTVAVIAQPDWRGEYDFERFGRPNLGFLVSSGNVDSMVAHYTAAKRKRGGDAYSPGGKSGERPDRALNAYCAKIREAYHGIPIIIGGLEASLRRFAHYDYWDDKVLPSILVSSCADILVYGMGERQITEIAKRLRKGEKISDINDIRGTCYITLPKNAPLYGKECPSFENITASKKEYAVAARVQHDEQDHIRGKLLKQRHGGCLLVQNPPAAPLSQEELDAVYALPFERAYHPVYKDMGGIPAIEEVEFSITHNRGCFGDCNFCALSFHQGRAVASRSRESVLDEAKLLTKLENFKGYIHDIGGPTANFRAGSCEKQKTDGLCKGKKCLAPAPCGSLEADHGEYLEILRAVRASPGVKKVFVRSGIRYDYLKLEGEKTFFKELCEHHVSGQLKIAPEHCSAYVLDKMGKPHIEAYVRFAEEYKRLSKKAGKEQYLVPYLMSSHP
ncbi:MAG: YgiQ family radical SAM protein, partial [Oscillospiraceae bacterium]|nr:YgiQ family radical SAM protein [Oscillospiraceae bacterium]